MEITKKISIYWKILIILIVFTAIANLMACSESFCDIYTDNVYGVIADAGGRIINGLPVPIGELMMYVGIILVILSALLMMLLVIFRKRDRYRLFVAKYMKGMLCIFVIIMFVYTFNWIIPFRSSLMGKSEYSDRSKVKFLGTEQQDTKKVMTEQSGRVDSQSLSDNVIDDNRLKIIRTYIIDNLNVLADEVERDSGGHIIYSEKDEVEQKVAAAMQGLSDEFPRLAGFYPRLKFAVCSELLNYMWIGGYTYPYTMEITGNRYTYADRLYYPALYAHESAHHQGYYQENEANLLEYLGCINSDDKVIQYAGYLAMYYYIDDAYTSVLTVLDDESLWDEYDSIQVVDQVWTDSAESAANSDAEFENADRPMRQFEGTAEDVADVGWETQGELLDENSYDGVVELLLIYYEGKLY